MGVRRGLKGERWGGDVDTWGGGGGGGYVGGEAR